MRCNLCWKNTKCPCRGGGCPGCWQNNNQVTYTNELLNFWMKPEMIRENFDFIHKAQRSHIQAFDIWDNLVNGKELSEEKKEAIENGKAIINKEVPRRDVKADSDLCHPMDNPTMEHDFPSKTNPWVRCKYCCGLAKYVRKDPCPAFKWDNKE